MDTRDTAKHGNRYDDDVKERAYQLWAFQAGRNADKVAALLSDDATALGEPCEVHARTIRRWANDDGWPMRVRDELRAIAPDMQTQTVAELVMGALASARYIRAINEGWEEPNRDRIAAALGNLDRAGYSHVGNRPAPAIGEGANGKPAELPALATASTVDDLLRLEAQMRAKRQKDSR